MQLAILESAAARLQSSASQQQELSQQLDLLRQQAAQVEVLGREVASLAGVPVVLAKLQSRHDTLQAKVRSLMLHTKLRTEKFRHVLDYGHGVIHACGGSTHEIIITLYIPHSTFYRAIMSCCCDLSTDFSDSDAPGPSGT